MPNTTNFNFPTPADTDLVKDGASAIRSLGNSIDTTFVDLKGGTTGQVLSKASNTDMDFTWVAQDDSNAIQNALLTTTGDTIYASSASTPARLGIGTTGQVLTVSGGVPSWATPAGTTASWSLLNSGGTSLSGTTVTVSGISGRNRLMILIEKASSDQASAGFDLRINADSGSTYTTFDQRITALNTYSTAVVSSNDPATGTEYKLASLSSNAASAASGYIKIDGCNSSGLKMINSSITSTASGGNSNRMISASGYWDNTATVTSISIVSTLGNFDGGKIYVYATNN